MSREKCCCCEAEMRLRERLGMDRRRMQRACGERGGGGEGEEMENLLNLFGINAPLLGYITTNSAELSACLMSISGSFRLSSLLIAFRCICRFRSLRASYRFSISTLMSLKPLHLIRNSCFFKELFDSIHDILAGLLIQFLLLLMRHITVAFGRQVHEPVQSSWRLHLLRLIIVIQLPLKKGYILYRIFAILSSMALSISSFSSESVSILLLTKLESLIVAPIDAISRTTVCCRKHALGPLYGTPDRICSQR